MEMGRQEGICVPSNNLIPPSHFVLTSMGETPKIYWQRAVHFPLFDHVIQELNDRLLSQQNHFLGQYLVSAKLNAFNSILQDKLYETHKTDLLEKRDFDIEILRWQTKWSLSNNEKTSDTHRDTPARWLGLLSQRGHNYYHPPDNANVNCYPRVIF